MIAYRPEIDGLRAWAVIPVILFHAQIAGFDGGFIGVDIFFVISGFLITSILITELQNDSFSIINFYDRRARRILPALFTVVVCCIPFAWIWMSPDQLLSFAKSVISVPIFSSNFLFWRSTGYFEPTAAEMPLFHTWSLAVEEQYYIFFPLLLLFVKRYLGNSLLLVVLLITLSNFFFSIWLTDFRPSASFLLLPGRIWELGVGSLLAFISITNTRNKGFANLATFLGLLLISLSIVYFDNFTTHPGVLTLIPITGCVLIIMFAEPSGILVRVFLSNSVAVEIGKRSYSLYLWHYPVFAFLAIRGIDTHSSAFGLIFSLLLISVLSIFSYEFIERPFRQRDLYSRKLIFSLSFIFSIILVAFGTIVITKNGFPERYPNEINLVINESFSDKDCDWESPVRGYPRLKLCQFGDNSASSTVILWGDSHATALLSSLDKELIKQRKRGLRIRNQYCEDIIGLYTRLNYDVDSVNACKNSQIALAKFLTDKTNKLSSAIIAMRWTARLSPIKDEISSVYFDNEEGGVEKIGPIYPSYAIDENGTPSQSKENKTIAILSFLRWFNDLNIPVIVQYPVPEVGWEVRDYLHKFYLEYGSLPKSISTKYNIFIKRNRFITEVLKSLEEREAFIPLNPSDIFCNTFMEGRCVAYINGQIFYDDNDHLNMLGADMVIENIVDKL